MYMFSLISCIEGYLYILWSNLLVNQAPSPFSLVPPSSSLFLSSIYHLPLLECSGFIS